MKNEKKNEWTDHKNDKINKTQTSQIVSLR